MNPGPARVLEALRRAGGESRSGESLSAEQGVSRAQVWKHVEALRAHGYTIEALAGDGYRLTATPDRLLPEEIQDGLATRWLARDIHWFEETDSTNRVRARARAERRPARRRGGRGGADRGARATRPQLLLAPARQPLHSIVLRPAATHRRRARLDPRRPQWRWPRRSPRGSTTPRMSRSSGPTTS